MTDTTRRGVIAAFPCPANNSSTPPEDPIGEARWHVSHLRQRVAEAASDRGRAVSQACLDWWMSELARLAPPCGVIELRTKGRLAA